jgi:putative MATE family efflux protein
MQNPMLLKVGKLAFPVAIQSALVAVLALADLLMVSDFGMAATAAVGIASKWHFVAIMIMAGLSSANGVLVAQYWGKNDRRSAKTVTQLALWFGIKLLIPITLLITLFASSILLLQTSDLTVIELGASYLYYSFPVLLLTHLVIVAESSMRASGDAFTPLLLGALTIIVNIVLNFWFINGGLGLPMMGVAGAALATSISRLLQVCLIAYYLKRKKHWLIQEKSLQETHSLWLVYKTLAFPTAANALLWAAGTLAYQTIFGHLGTSELAVYSMLGPLESLCYSVFFGISVACSILLGQALGRDEYAQALNMTYFFIRTVLVCGLFLGALLLSGSEYILSWLGLTGLALYPLASPAITILSCAIWLRMLNMLIINGILRAGGDNLFCLRMDFIAMWMIGIPLAGYGAFIAEWDFRYVYLIMIVEEIVKFSLCFHRYLQRRWMNNLTLVAGLAS